MRTIDAVRRSGIGIESDRTVREAAALMDTTGVGSLVVLDGGRLAGIVTDRDLVRRALGAGLPSDARVDSVMSTPVLTIDADADLRDAFSRFREHAVRRLAVVRDGELVGMIAVDDLLIDLSADLADLVRPVTAETIFGQRDSEVPATTGD